jgi:hypothetical protein
MSLIRLSVLKETPFAPDPAGTIDLRGYTRRRRTGRLEPLSPPVLAGPRSHFRHYLDGEVARAASSLAPAAPVVVMVHGFLFDPKAAVSAEPRETDNPHGRLYHYVDGIERDEQRHHTSGWPLWLEFDADDETGASGLAVAFGWQSQPGFATSLIEHFENFYARAYDYAGSTAWVLVNVLHALAANDQLAGRPIDIFCHSLGSRVVMRALALAAKRRERPGDAALDEAASRALLARVGRIVILGGAEYVVEAQLTQARLNALALDGGLAVYNVVSRENDVLDVLGENFGPRTFGNSNVIGHNGLDIALPEERADRPRGWIDLQIDSLRLQEWMAARGIAISGDRPGNVWDHWYYYTYRGNMEVYRRILRDRDAWSIAALRENEVPEGVSRRRSIFGD